MLWIEDIVEHILAPPFFTDFRIDIRPRQGKVKGKRVIQLNLLLPYSLPYPIATC
jgi:hypothetical protein